ncbi:MAG: hydantoinase/oxoprolinase family protein [Lachnospiraceae bacterium]|jgi:N-methylhydantoinase A/oxoprolinase/acetone carboxylase beta subunit
MSYVIGIDTGGTYTDAVLLDTKIKGPDCIKRKAKAITRHENLELGIRDSIQHLHLKESDIHEIEKVVLSTTLATNATVEGKIGKVGLLMIGGTPVGKLATDEAIAVEGKVNIKGRVLRDIDREEVTRAVKTLLPRVESFAVSGQASVRNPILEQRVRAVIKDLCDLPVVCGHELVFELGYLERTNTAVVNAGLLPIIDDFVRAIKAILQEQKIEAPVFVVKGDGTIAKIDSIRNTPIDTVLSGPAASIVGAINLTGVKDAVVADMGGTTTDIGIVRNKRVELSREGAVVGDWRIRIKSAKLYTYGLGGDSAIKIDDGKIEAGPERQLPSCRGGKDHVTPTDILHYTGEFVQWDRKRAVEAIEEQARQAEMTADEYVEETKNMIADKIYNNLKRYRRIRFPISAIGAPAESWYRIAQKKYDFDLMIPKHYEVANAVGAATSGVSVEADAVVRPGEDSGGYLLHTVTERLEFDELKDALQKGLELTKAYAKNLILEQNLEVSYIRYECRNMYLDGDQIMYKTLQVREDGSIPDESDGDYGKYLETQIKVLAGGKMFIHV